MSRRSLALLCVLLVCSVSAIGPDAPKPKIPWHDGLTLMSVAEYLDLLFHVRMSRPELVSLNSFNVVQFFPNESPDESFVLILQTYRDGNATQAELHRAIREVGDAELAYFETLCASPAVRKRWQLKAPKRNLIIRHVRHSDRRETLGVTVNGETTFDPEGIKNAAAEVRSRGGTWQ